MPSYLDPEQRTGSWLPCVTLTMHKLKEYSLSSRNSCRVLGLFRYTFRLRVSGRLGQLVVLTPQLICTT